MAKTIPSGTPFFLVWNPARSGPTYKHTTLKQAQAEAERLARLTPGTFYVMAAVESFELTTLENVGFPFDRGFEDAKVDPDDDVPF